MRTFFQYKAYELRGNRADNQSNDFIIHERELKSQPFAVVTSEGQYLSTLRVGLSTVYQR